MALETDFGTYWTMLEKSIFLAPKHAPPRPLFAFRGGFWNIGITFFFYFSRLKWQFLIFNAENSKFGPKMLSKIHFGHIGKKKKIEKNQKKIFFWSKIQNFWWTQTFLSGRLELIKSSKTLLYGFRDLKNVYSGKK